MPKFNLDWAELGRVKSIVEYKTKLKGLPPTFDSYLRAVSPHLTWDWKHLRYIRRDLDHILDGSLKRLMIFCPPRHGKTEMTTLHFPAYFLEKHPSKRVIISAYNQMLANTFSRRIRGIVEERLELNKERTAVEQWETAEKGSLRASGVGSGLTGLGCDLAIIDDPVKDRVEANSKVVRQRQWEWYKDVLSTRLEPNGAIILIMTRWHYDDLASRILASEECNDWKVISLPALAKKDDLLGRAEGEALCPDRYTIEDLQKLKRLLGQSFEALYQQNPVQDEGGIIRISAFKRYHIDDLRKIDFTFQSWDTAFRTNEQNDYSVCTTWAVAENNLYLIDRWKGKLDLSLLIQKVNQLALQHRPNVGLIEDHASGSHILDQLRQLTAIPWLAVRPLHDKIARTNATTPLIEVGRVFIPNSAPWLEDYLTTLARFPYDDHDDDVDSTSQALNYFLQRFGYKQESDMDKSESIFSSVSGWGV